jgi:hypothetical protein
LRPAQVMSRWALPLLGENQEDFGLVCGGVLAKNSKKET